MEKINEKGEILHAGKLRDHGSEQGSLESEPNLSRGSENKTQETYRRFIVKLELLRIGR